VVHLLRRKREEWKLDDHRAMIVGQRIARTNLSTRDTEGDVIFRGSVVGVQDKGRDIDDDWFLVLYDEGRVEELQVRLELEAHCITKLLSHLSVVV
jgi:hypothetical protein